MDGHSSLRGVGRSPLPGVSPDLSYHARRDRDELRTELFKNRVPNPADQVFEVRSFEQ